MMKEQYPQRCSFCRHFRYDRPYAQPRRGQHTQQLLALCAAHSNLNLVDAGVRPYQEVPDWCDKFVFFEE